jgi:hypothetical protein
MNDGKVLHFLATAVHCRPEAPLSEARSKDFREASGPITQAVLKAQAG